MLNGPLFLGIVVGESLFAFLLVNCGKFVGYTLVQGVVYLIGIGVM